MLQKSFLFLPLVSREQQKMDIPQTAPSAGHQGLITSTLIKTQHISAGIFAQILTSLVAFKNSAQLQGRRLKTGRHRCHSQERVPKQKLLLPSLWNSQVCSPFLFPPCCLIFSAFLMTLASIFHTEVSFCTNYRISELWHFHIKWILM